MESRRMWCVGDFRVELEDGGLRYLTYKGFEIVRGIYAAIRDRDWGTIEPRLGELAVIEDEGGMTLTFECEHVKEEIDFTWTGTIRLSATEIRFDFDGLARSSFLKNRIGFCVLHPMEYAGLPLVVESAAGRVEGCFPEKVSPHQPYKEIKSLQYEPVTGLQVRMEFDGDLFEMEDQRNWTDASFKTYCTPLEIPFPVRVEAGERIRQSIRIAVTGEPSSEVNDRAVPVRLTLGDEPIGLLPQIGFSLSDHERDQAEFSLLKQLSPSFLRVVLDLEQEDWMTKLGMAVDLASNIKCEIEIELILSADDSLDSLAGFLAKCEGPLVRVAPYRRGCYVSEQSVLSACKRAFERHGLKQPVGGGTLAYYAEFNRASLPLDLMDFAAYSINPQVHAFDDRSLMETLNAQAVTAMDATGKAGKPLVIGPITFKPRLNPNATSGSGIALDQRIDARQDAMFGAAWALGSLASLSLPGVKALTYFETRGPLGLVEGQRTRPMFQVFKDIAPYKEASILRIEGEGVSRSIAVMALRNQNQVRVLAANLTGNQIEFELDTGSYQALRISTYADRNMVPQRYGGNATKVVSIGLAPYGYCCIDTIRG